MLNIILHPPKCGLQNVWSCVSCMWWCDSIYSLGLFRVENVSAIFLHLPVSACGLRNNGLFSSIHPYSLPITSRSVPSVSWWIAPIPANPHKTWVTKGARFSNVGKQIVGCMTYVRWVCVVVERRVDIHFSNITFAPIHRWIACDMARAIDRDMHEWPMWDILFAYFGERKTASCSRDAIYGSFIVCDLYILYFIHAFCMRIWK